MFQYKIYNFSIYLRLLNKYVQMTKLYYRNVTKLTFAHKNGYVL